MSDEEGGGHSSSGSECEEVPPPLFGNIIKEDAGRTYYESVIFGEQEINLYDTIHLTSDEGMPPYIAWVWQIYTDGETEEDSCNISTNWFYRWEDVTREAMVPVHDVRSKQWKDQEIFLSPICDPNTHDAFDTKCKVVVCKDGKVPHDIIDFKTGEYFCRYFFNPVNQTLMKLSEIEGYQWKQNEAVWNMGPTTTQRMADFFAWAKRQEEERLEGAVEGEARQRELERAHQYDKTRPPPSD